MRNLDEIKKIKLDITIQDKNIQEALRIADIDKNEIDNISYEIKELENKIKEKTDEVKELKIRFDRSKECVDYFVEKKIENLKKLDNIKGDFSNEQF